MNLALEVLGSSYIHNQNNPPGAYNTQVFFFFFVKHLLMPFATRTITIKNHDTHIPVQCNQNEENTTIALCSGL